MPLGGLCLLKLRNPKPFSSKHYHKDNCLLKSSINNNSTPMGTSQENLVDAFCSEMDEAKEDIESMSSAHIYRVPKALRELNESAYTPRLVSIGPLHSDDGHLNPHMKKIKTLGRKNDANLKCVEESLMFHLKSDSSNKRYLALLVMDIFFSRSKYFRSIMVQDLKEIMVKILM